MRTRPFSSPKSVRIRLLPTATATRRPPSEYVSIYLPPVFAFNRQIRYHLPPDLKTLKENVNPHLYYLHDTEFKLDTDTVSHPSRLLSLFTRFVSVFPIPFTSWLRGRLDKADKKKLRPAVKVKRQIL